MGRATAHLFADEGARVAVVDREREMASMPSPRRSPPPAARPRASSSMSATPPAIVALVRDVVARFGGVDILVNNAGVSVPAPIDSDDLDEAWARTFAVNLTAQARLVRALPAVSQGEGRRARGQHRLHRRPRRNRVHQPVHRRASTA